MTHLTLILETDGLGRKVVSNFLSRLQGDVVVLETCGMISVSLPEANPTQHNKHHKLSNNPKGKN